MAVSTPPLAPPTPADLRAEIARKRIFLYQLAPPLGFNAVLIGRWLNRKAPMPEDVALRLARIIEQWGDCDG